VTWLFNSKGEPVAYLNQGYVYSIFASYLGKLDNSEIWNRAYQGEIVDENRLLIKLTSKHGMRARNLEEERGRRHCKRPPIPDNQAACSLPLGFEDIDLHRPPTIDESWSHTLAYNDKFYAVFLRHPQIDTATALDCLVSTLRGEQPTFGVQYTECDTRDEADKALLNLQFPSAPVKKKKVKSEEIATNNIDKERPSLRGNDKAWLVVGLVFFGAIFFGFIRLMIVDGPASAFENAAGPAFLFVIVVVFGWFILSGYLQDKGAKNIGKAMWSIGSVVVILFILSVMLSKCGVTFDSVENIQPPRSL
jgi:hypothetical protein